MQEDFRTKTRMECCSLYFFKPELNSVFGIVALNSLTFKLPNWERNCFSFHRSWPWNYVAEDFLSWNITVLRQKSQIKSQSVCVCKSYDDSNRTWINECYRVFNLRGENRRCKNQFLTNSDLVLCNITGPVKIIPNPLSLCFSQFHLFIKAFQLSTSFYVLKSFILVSFLQHQICF